VRAGHLLSHAYGCAVTVACAVDGHPTTASEDLEQARVRVGLQLIDVLTARPEWPVVIEQGRAAQTICRMAAEHRADLIVLGLGRHRAIDQFLDAEVAIHVQRQAAIPVLAVPSTFDRLPTRLVVGTDFGRASLHAARAALAVRGAGAALDMVYVRTVFDPAGPEPDDPADPTAAETAAFFDVMEDAVGIPDDVQHIRVVLEGNPKHELLQYARRRQSDLIAVGTHGRSAIERSTLGSIAMHVIRSADCAVLVSGLIPVPVHDTQAPQTRAAADRR
jgi:nucleotide-binding universal stress UspA family protein